MIEVLEFLINFGDNVFTISFAWILISSWSVTKQLPKNQLWMTVGGLYVAGIAQILLWFFK